MEKIRGRATAAALAALLAAPAAAEWPSDAFARGAEQSVSAGSRIAERQRAGYILVVGNTMRLYDREGGSLLREFRVALGQAGRETPTGRFRILRQNRHTRFRGALVFLETRNPYEIHGPPNDGQAYSNNTNWTHGCIAVTAEEMQEVLRLVRIGATLDIRRG